MAGARVLRNDDDFLRMRKRPRDNSTAFTALKIAVLAPIPSARIATATKTKPGDFRSKRSPYARSRSVDSHPRTDPQLATLVL